MKRLQNSRVFCLCAVLALSGCAAQVPSTATVPGRAATPIENILAWDTAIATANEAIANNVISLQASGAISISGANRILTAQSIIADSNRQLTAVLQQCASGCVQNSAQIRAFIAQIQTATQGLIAAGDLGIKNTASQQAIITGMNSITSLAQQIVSALTAASLIQ